MSADLTPEQIDRSVASTGRPYSSLFDGQLNVRTRPMTIVQAQRAYKAAKKKRRARPAPMVIRGIHNDGQLIAAAKLER